MDDETPNSTSMEEEGNAMAESHQGFSRSQRARGVLVRKTKKTSRCWLLFKELPLVAGQKKKAECSKCGEIYQCDSQTGAGSLLRHHDVCYYSGTVLSPQFATLSLGFRYEKFSELVIEGIIRHDFPFSFVEYEGIRAIFDYISPILKLPCRNTVKSHVSKIFANEKLKLQDMLSSVPGRICLTSDLWSSQDTDGYLTLTAHWVDSDWNLQKKILSFCHMPPPHNGILLAEKINSLICEWNIDDKLFSITLDNASANDSFVEKLITQLNFRGLLVLNEKNFHIQCCAHILNLIVQDELKAIDHSVIKIRECIKYIKDSMARKEKFLECIAQVGLRGSKRGLRQDVPTRWNSTYLMLDGALFYRRALINFALTDMDFKCCPTAEEWDKVEKISKFLGYFYDVTVLFSGTNYPTSNLFFPKVFVIQHNIEQAMEHEDGFLRQMGIEMYLKFQKYWSDYSLILGIAVVMDPRYKMEFVQWAYEKLYGPNSDELQKFEDTLSSLFDAYVDNYSNPDNTSGIMSERCSQTKGEDSVLQDFDATYKNGSSLGGKSDLQKYLDEDKMIRRTELNVLSWWKREQFNYPILVRLARDVLTIPISTVAYESAFSIAGRVLDQYRSSLLHANVQALLCTRDWIFVKKSQDLALEELTPNVLDLRLDEHSQTRLTSQTT